MNIAIMRVFVKLKRMLDSRSELAGKLAELERKLEGHDGQIRTLFDAIRQMMAPPEPSARTVPPEDRFSSRVVPHELELAPF